ncbi:GLPGLI family protein [uncultured Lutibacter sp.]|uniref:GLPGLI family protein n=1 Tax=uncultured Lutibacter sp. TaxID=437739 RepID=UPI00262A4356|nr:GLPGLI family protein [uncultured Lutibacter sp.]
MNFLKYFSIFILVMLFNASKACAQKLSGEVIYQYRVYNDFLKLDSLSENKNERVKGVISAVNESLINYQEFFKFSLIFDEDSSNYFWNNMLQNDSMGTMKFAKILTSSNSFYYTSLKDSVTIEARDFYEKKIIIKRTIKDLHWELINESKKIGDYICFKATTTKKAKKNIVVEAWYTPQIPNGFGPKEYSGLPGLILELKEGDIHYYSNRILLNPNDRKKIVKNLKGEIMSFDQFNNFLLGFD